MPDTKERLEAIGRTLQVEVPAIATASSKSPADVPIQDEMPTLANSTVHIVVPMSWPFYPQLPKESMEKLRKCPTTQKIEVNECSISSMRNAGIRVARAYKPSHILLVDADMVFDADALERLLAHDVDVVGGLCRSRVKPFAATLYQRDEKATTAGLRLRRRVEPKGTGLQRFSATGGAFLLVKATVFNRLDARGACGSFFRDCRDRVDWCEADRVSEDLYFCQSLEDAGIPLHVDLDVTVGHLTTAIVIDRAEPGGTHRPAMLLPKGINEPDEE